MKILHIEDDYDFSFFLRENLEQFGVETVHFADAQEALKHLEKNPELYDLIIVDGNPGVLSGDLVVSEIRDITLKVPVLAQSDASNYIQKMFTAGAVGAVPRNLKPEDFVKLESVLRELVLRFSR